MSPVISVTDATVLPLLALRSAELQAHRVRARAVVGRQREARAAFARAIEALDEGATP